MRRKLALIHVFLIVTTGVIPVQAGLPDGLAAYFKVDEVRIYDRALSAAEVTGIYQMPVVPRLKAWAPSPADGARDVVRTGAVWSFTTIVPMDDFESYNDEENKGTRIYETWLDGVTNKGGSTVGYWDPPFAEQKIVHGGKQSMPLDYNNVSAPFYSEAERGFAPAEDWTALSTGTLVLYVRGRANNAPARMYVAIEDASNHSAAVMYPDLAPVTATRWIEWRIPLSDFAGVNAARVKKMSIGVGDKANPVAAEPGCSSSTTSA